MQYIPLKMVRRNSAVRSSLEGIKRIASMTIMRRGSTKDSESQLLTIKKPCPRYIWRLLLDLPLLLIVVGVLITFELGYIPSKKYGFYCNDPTLSHKFNGDTITNTVLGAGVILLPIIIFFSTELVRNTKTDGKFWSSCRKSLRLFRKYGFGLLLNTCIFQLMKGLVGEPRPSFFDLCKPDAAENCTANEFITEFKCTSSYSRNTQIDSYRSFPSGHAAYSVFCALYVVWYLQVRAFSWRNRSVLIVPLVQLCVLSFALISSLTRITDYRHHWWDVLAGAVIAVMSVVYTVLFASSNFSSKRRNFEDKEDLSQTMRSISVEQIR